ncbi:MAG: hypothetical protein A2087_07225 [Spirochaetes bacterium GWD1_61_31]|nr:MAG: hypothetical protein A2Y37_08250 [Spirochaetes bacterium GWB1_60_80]OHD34204.1 MAG: hypothetical protein A2004_12495 [Spirochaetes bacterium GWC1_61_12]OHD40132.1 MAG: hypothetical protein A2087_07225 [Spirochaetes bacterium GWD1_61_31]OHD45820.1 MAG: hypothetical protein A2Y35_03885 [Spirochaetes bacterium GWE1_60_18]OHD58363.1 MAG: hypothetical protein A2Y32_06275 [Spirochaetes bacterium GWF1_60_12]
MTQQLTILHTNDLHAHYDEWLQCAGFIKRRRAELGAERVLFVDCGDHCDISASVCKLSQGAVHADLLSDAGCDAFVPGNNEMFRFSLEQINAMAARSRFPWVLSTVGSTASASLAAHASVIVDKGIRLGLLGVIEPMDDAVGRLHGLESRDCVATLRDEAAALRAAGAELVILLSHYGLRDDQRLARELPGCFDVIVGGHSHSQLAVAETVGGTIIVQAGGMGQFVGELELTITDGKVVAHQARLHDSGAFAAADPEQRRILDSHQQAANGVLERELFQLAAPLSKPELVGLLASINRLALGTQIGLMFGPAAIEGLPAGTVRVADLYRVSKSMLTPASFKLSGRQIRQLLTERLEAAYNDRVVMGIGFRPQGLPFGPLEVAGLRWTETATGPADIAVAVEASPTPVYQPLADDEWYSVAGLTHLANSENGGFPALDGSTELRFTRFTYLRDVVCRYFESPGASARLGHPKLIS